MKQIEEELNGQLTQIIKEKDHLKGGDGFNFRKSIRFYEIQYFINFFCFFLERNRKRDSKITKKQIHSKSKF